MDLDLAASAAMATLDDATRRGFVNDPLAALTGLGPVSYTHLDVYKRQSQPRAVPDPWPQHWGQVPAPWRDGVYAIDADPFADVFVQNARYQRGRAFDFRPPGPHRLAQEAAWWIWTCHHEGLRKIEPSMLRWWAAAVGSLTAHRSAAAGRAPMSIADLEPHLVAREAVRLFAARNGRPPSPGNLRNLISIANHVHLLVSVLSLIHI